MWQVYPYGHTKLKLNKDLKTAEAHLRISLIDSDQIENMGRIYNDRKDYYKINSDSFSVPKYVQQQVNQEATTHLSYKEKVDLYRQRLQQQKLESKYNNLFKKTEKRKYKMRKPVLYKMLQNFQQNHKHEDNINVIEDLKESQKNLEMIKINTNRRATFKRSSKHSSMLDRPRFISLENGLPEKEAHQFPDWRDYLEGKYQKMNQSAFYTNIFELQNKLDTISENKTKIKKSNNTNTFTLLRQASFSPPPLRQKTASYSKTNYIQQENYIKAQKEPNFTCERCKQEPELKRHGIHNEEDNISRAKTFNNHVDIERRKLYSRQFNKKAATDQNVSKTAEKIFTKSQNCSKQVIATMNGFYECKSNKKEDYKKMVYHLKNDRPLTSDIRRNNYRVIGEQNIPQVKKYRFHSQNQRLKLKEKNSSFYLELLQALSSHNIEELPLSGKIMQRVKKILSSNYIINREQYEYIVQPSLYEQRDVKSQYLINRIQTLLTQQK